MSLFHALLAHVFSGISNDVQVVGGAESPMAQGQVMAQSTVDPRGQSAGYIMGTLTGPARTNTGPAVHLPGHVLHYSTPLLMHRQTGASQLVGYTAEHATYPAVWHERIQEAYLVHNREVVVIEVRLVIKSPGRVKAELVHVCFKFQASDMTFKH